MGSGATRSWDWHKIQAGFVRINPGDYVRFDVDTSSSSTVYISVITEDGRLVANALPRREDLSVIVGANAQIYDTVHGKLWQDRSEEHTSELQSHSDLVCRLLLEKKKQKKRKKTNKKIKL